MALTKPPVLPPWAEAGDKVQPTNAEIQTGWPLSNTPPARQRWNWILNFLANGVRYLTRRGMPDYDAAETYMTGDRIIGDDGKTYRSLIDNNTAQTPSTSPTKWEEWAPTLSRFAALIQGQTYTAFTTAGAAPNFTLTPSPAIAAYAAGQRFRVKFHAAGTGTDVLNVSTLGNKSLKQYNNTGAKVAAVVAAGQLADVEYDGVDFVVIDTLPSSERSAAAGGTVDAITATYSPAVSALANGITVYVRPSGANTSTTPTFSPNGLTAKTIVKGNNLPLVPGDIAGAGHWVQLQYDATLDKWVLSNPATGVSVVSGASIQGAFKNLQISAGGLAASISVSYDELILGDGAGTYVTERNIAGTITTTNTGAGGLDTGTLAASTWYSIWRIGKTDGTRAWLFSLSATAPTMPTGYTLKARIGWFRTDATNKYPLSFIQHGRRVDYKVIGSSNVPNYPIMASGAQGNWIIGTWVAVAVSAFVPSTASVIHVVSVDEIGGETILSPNGNHGGGSSTTNPPPFCQDAGSGCYDGGPASLHLESTNIYRASHGGVTACVGWDDNL